jgi:hypothetical protein
MARRLPLIMAAPAALAAWGLTRLLLRLFRRLRGLPRRRRGPI